MGMETAPADMVFHYRRFGGEAALPEAYERLLLDAIHGDATLFAREDEIELAWGLVDPLLKVWERPDAPNLHIYPGCSWGPKEADEMLEREGRSWQLGCAPM
jgi:glucose-6-phosphate 1-dehydrogenase